MHERFETYSEEETRAAGRRLAARLPKDALVAFSGDLGCGKTAFIRGMCEHFGCERQVTSPTFTIINEYMGDSTVTHCDLYRLNTMEEMLQIGLQELFTGEGLVLIEWAERARPLLPFPRYEVAAWHGDREEQRRYEIRFVQEEDESILFVPAELFARQA
ncbi:MAG: tRNA (adenosine(37)-N6)-threonylcarbamoyltransferase complex ATPase subunit type 1 TsaE [Bacteroidetes bacterium]|nr:tRNA (adenosine(37)-N6)-threonylcarbamoyltransferase complex ATPase subunit type 1 TsaE [Bacteroidota bacterium]